MSKTVNEIVSEYLEKNGYDGLTDLESGCFCPRITFSNCTGDGQCQAAYDRNGKISTEDLEPEQKGLPVRIAVAVDPAKKEWNCAGWKLNGHDEPSDQVKADSATEEMYGERQIYFVTAVIPITEPPVIVGRIEKEGE